MTSNSRAVPAHIQTIVDTIMANNRDRFGGWSMSLNTDVSPDPVVPPVASVPDPDKVFTQADIAAAVEKARAQEKDKLYGRLSNLESDLASFNAREQERQQAEAAAASAAEAEQRRLAEESMSAKELLAQKEREWQETLAAQRTETEQRFAQMAQEREQERALLEKEREFATLAAYTQKRIGEEQDTIAPQFVDFIQGSSPDEIESAIAVAKAKSAEIAEQVRSAAMAVQSQQRGVSATGYAPVGPLDSGDGSRQYSATDIAGMSMQEYAALRQKIPGLGQGAPTNRGMFG